MFYLMSRKIRWIFLAGIVSLIPTVISASVTLNAADSLQKLLKANPDAGKRAIVYVHLADLYADSLDRAYEYWDKALSEAIKVKDEYITKLALEMLVKRYATKDKTKVEKYISISEQSLPEKQHALFRAYLYCYNIWAEMRKNNSLGSIGQELERLKLDSKGQMTPEVQIQWEYLTGVSLDYASLLTHTYDDIPKAIPYIEGALKKLATYPIEDRIHFERLCRYELSDLYMAINDKRAVAETKKMLELYNRWNDMNPAFKRNFFDDSSYYEGIYARMIFFTDLISKEEATECYQKYIRLARKKKHINKIYEVSARYYQRMDDYKTAIAYIDSALQKINYEPVNMVPIYVVKANLCNKIGDYKSAYLTLKKSNELRDLENSKQVHEQMMEMQTRFDVNKLQLEKIKLANRNKQMALVAVFLLLIALIVWGIYQSNMVKRLKKMHKQLMAANEEVKEQSIKATESEKMKTAFLNSICHEIRTPLNSINGFSELLFDDSLDTKTKQEFQFQIQSNTTMLTSLVDNMLELSRLVSSESPLPVQKVNVYEICLEEMETLRKNMAKPEIECMVEGNTDESVLQTNAFYLSRVIGNLLNNAAKFTERGSIGIVCKVDKEKQQLIVAVTDTGIGIPTDKQEWVFERFTKMDDFKPGTGLGLYICRIIIQRLGGFIHIDSGYTTGCKVVVTLPV